MGILSTLTQTLKASTQSTARGSRSEKSEGAYWCHDCDERVLDLDVEGETPPTCPECGEVMEFERSPGTAGCAC